MRIGKLESFLLALIVASATLLFFLHLWLGDFRPVAYSQAAATSTVATEMMSPFIPPTLTASAAYVYDVRANKALYALNATSTLPLASLTKLMMALVAHENYSATSTIITINKDAIDQDGDNGLRLGEQWDLNTLLDFSLIVSSNDGAEAIADAYTSAGTPNAFVSLMNQEAQHLGLYSMTYFNPNGLDLDTMTSGGYGSAEDMTTLFSYITSRYPRLLEATTYKHLSFTSLSGFRHSANNTDTIINGIPDLIASKTGYTDLAGGNLVVEFDAGIDHPIIVAILGSTYDGRFTDVQKLVDATLNYEGQ